MKPAHGRSAMGRRPRLETLEARELLSTLTVTSLWDSTPGSLRDVVGRAASGDVVQFAPKLRGATLHLTGGEIAVTKSLTINGCKQVLSADRLSRVFHIDGPDVNVAIRSLSLVNGQATLDEDLGYVGGAIFATGANLSLINCSLLSNTAQGGGDSPDLTAVYHAGGGAIFANTSTVSLTNCVVRDNVALGGQNTLAQQTSFGNGGGVMLLNSSLTVTGGQFGNNLAHGGDAVNPIEGFPSSWGAYGAGGAIYAFQEQNDSQLALVLNGVKFCNNQAVGGKGLDAALSRNPLTEAGNGGEATGGAISLSGSGVDQTPFRVVINRSSFQNNTAQAGDGGTPTDSSSGGGKQGGRGAGGAVMLTENTDLSISGSTFDGNHAVGGGAGPNPAGLGHEVGWGGVALGGAVYTERGSQVDVSGTKFLNNIALGGQGPDSPPDGSSDAGAGGWSYGGALFTLNGRGGAGPSEFLLPVSLRDCVFQNNTVRGGEPGNGSLNEIHAGGGAQGGGADISAATNLTVIRTNWIGNRAIGGTSTMASGGGLATPYGSATSHTLIQGGIFRDNQAISGNDSPNVAYREASGGAFMINSPNTVLVGVTFQNNAAIGGADTGSGYAGTGMGGAIYDVGQHPSVELNACNFLGNVALGGATRGAGAGGGNNGQALGGAIYHNNGDLTIRGGRFAHNSAAGSLIGADRNAEGGAIYASPVNSAPGYDYVTNTYLAGVVFEANQAVVYGASVAAGGAIANHGNVLNDQGSRFLRNTARAVGGTAYGGALLHQQDTEQTGDPYVPSATLRGTLFDGNLSVGQCVPRGPAAQGFGGGIAFVNDPQATFPLVAFKRNKATTAGDNFWGTFHENAD